MPLTKAMEKLKKYYARFEDGRTEKIKPSHVEKVIKKLLVNEQNLLEEIEKTKKVSKKQRLKKKLAMSRKQLDRAQWLLKKVS